MTLDLNGHKISAHPDNDQTGLGVGEASDVVITGGRVRGFATGIAVAEAGQITVRKMNVAGASERQMSAGLANGIKLKNNVIGSQGETAVHFGEVDDTNVTGNVVRAGGIHLVGGTGHVVAENHILVTGVFVQADNVIVRRNHIERAGSGVATFGPTDTLRIARNRIERSSDLGIEIGAASTSVDIAENTILDSLTDGIFISDGSSGAIADNVVKRSGGDGIDNNENAMFVHHNTANWNGDFGIESDSGKLTFENTARNNGNPLQCFPAAGCN